MKWKHIPGNDKNWEKRPHQWLTSGWDFHIKQQLKTLLDWDFSNRLKEESIQLTKLNKTGSVQSFLLHDKKYVLVLSGDHKADYSGLGFVDLKARYGAVLKWYKLVYNKIIDQYAPEMPPYELKFPKIMYYKHTDDKDITVLEYIKLATLEDVSLGRVKIPKEHVSPINQFLHDWNYAMCQIYRERNIPLSSRYWTVEMPYGVVTLADDFWWGWNFSSDILHNVAYALDSQGEPEIYLTDALCSVLLENIKK